MSPLRIDRTISPLTPAEKQRDELVFAGGVMSTFLCMMFATLFPYAVLPESLSGNMFVDGAMSTITFLVTITAVLFTGTSLMVGQENKKYYAFIMRYMIFTGVIAGIVVPFFVK